MLNEEHCHPSRELLRERYEYREGALYYAKAHRGAPKGSRAGGSSGSISINGKTYSEASLIWLWHGRKIPKGWFVTSFGSSNDIRNLRIRQGKLAKLPHEDTLRELFVVSEGKLLDRRFKVPVGGEKYVRINGKDFEKSDVISKYMGEQT